MPLYLTAPLAGRLPYISVNYLANESRYQYARCVAASYHSDQPIIAVGLADGKVGICNFRDTYDSSWEYSGWTTTPILSCI